MTKLEKIEEHVKSNREWHSRRLQYYAQEGEIAKDIVIALEGMEFEFSMGTAIELKFANEEEVRKARGIITTTIEGIEKWDKGFNAYETYHEPEWRWEGRVKIDEMAVAIHIYPTSPKPDCVPVLKESQSYTSRSWVCELGKSDD
jgi:hypothetical protein